jgi:outer membrane lipase/esterase
MESAMKQWKWAAVAAACAMVVAGCGGGGNGNQAPAVQYSSVVSFGDSLSDAGTYGGKFTVNGITGVVGSDPVPSYTWAQLISAAATGSVSCPARIGGFGILETTSAGAGCTNYAQGGSRVLARNGVDYRPYVEGTITDGPLTEPVVTQVTHYLADAANGGKFTGKELVTVLAGANDIFGQVDILKADATAAGNAAGGQAFVAALAGALAAGATTPATAGPAIAGAFVAAKAAGASDQLAVSAAIQAAAAAGNTTVMNMVYINSVVVAGKQAGGATFPREPGGPTDCRLGPGQSGHRRTRHRPRH